MRERARFLPAARADLHEIWDYIAEFVIFYRRTKGGLEIVRVLSGWRDIPALF